MALRFSQAVTASTGRFLAFVAALIGEAYLKRVAEIKQQVSLKPYLHVVIYLISF
jgi:hypothetical protein